MEVAKAKTASPSVILACTKELIEHCGSDVNVVNQDGISPLIISSARGQLKTVKYLRENGADCWNKGTGNFQIRGLNDNPRSRTQVKGTYIAMDWARAMMAAEMGDTFEGVMDSCMNAVREEDIPADLHSCFLYLRNGSLAR